MGHGGMLYSLPSRDLIADSVEYMVNAHCADALVCISNCDKITPGMLNAALRLNIPTVFVSGGPMEGGTAVLVDGTVRKRLNLITAIADAVDDERLRRRHRADRGAGLPDLRLVLGDVHRQLDELPDRGARPVAARQRLDARDPHRAPRALRGRRPRWSSSSAIATTTRTTTACCRARRHSRRVRERDGARHRDGRLHQHRAARPRRRPGGRARLHDEGHRRGLQARAVHLQGRAERQLPDGGRAPRRRHPGDPRRAVARRPAQRGRPHRAFARTLDEWLESWDIRSGRPSERAIELFHAAPGCRRSAEAFSQSERWDTLDTDAAEGCIHDVEHAYSKDGGLAILYGNLAVRGAVVKTAGVDESIWKFSGPAVVVESQEDGGRRDPRRRRQGGRRRRDPLRGTARRPRHAGDALPDLLPEGQGARQGLRADHRRALLAAAPRGCRSATSRPRRHPAARSRWSRTATRSRSTSPTGGSRSRSPRRSSPSAASGSSPAAGYVPNLRERSRLAGAARLRGDGHLGRHWRGPRRQRRRARGRGSRCVQANHRLTGRSGQSRAASGPTLLLWTCGQ